MPIKLCGILNLTPDSFSDGGRYGSTEEAYACAQKMVADGAKIIDVGGDSTRPGSICVDLEEEWRRISEVLKLLAKEITVSVDTHRAEIARRAINEGAKIINDISAGADPDMFSVVSDSDASFVLMFSTCEKPHQYSEDKFLGIGQIKDFFTSRLQLAKEAGIKKERIILDPGMGRFISNDANDSFMILDNLKVIEDLGHPIMLGLSRKGFLPDSSDETSAKYAYRSISSLSEKTEVILRVHNVKAHKI